MVHVAVTNDVIAQIKSMISRGELKPGDRLPPEQELASYLGLSRSSLREAIKALDVIRVLEVKRGDGTYVTSLEPKFLLEAISFVVDIHEDTSLFEIFEVRRILESQASGLAALRAGPGDISALRAESAAVAALSSDVDQLVEHDVKFHLMISELSGNQYLENMISGLTSRTVRARAWRVLTQEDAVEKTLREHEQIIDAIEAHDQDRAIAAAADHISGVEDWLKKARLKDA
jgi:GntR family transcriptional repressor for pyruvate dehydrogenase complex